MFDNQLVVVLRWYYFQLFLFLFIKEHFGLLINHFALSHFKKLSLCFLPFILPFVFGIVLAIGRFIFFLLLVNLKP